MKFKKKTEHYEDEIYLKKNLIRNNKNYIYNCTETLSGKKIVTSGLGFIQYQFCLKIY